MKFMAETGKKTKTIKTVCTFTVSAYNMYKDYIF